MNETQKSIWIELVKNHHNFIMSIDIFLSDPNKVVIIKQGLMGSDRTTALVLLQYLEIDELKQLFEELVILSSFSHGGLHIVRELILKLPRDWVLEEIENKVNKIIENGNYDEYRRILELYFLLDSDLTLRLAMKACNSDDYDIREAGQDFVNKVR